MLSKDPFNLDLPHGQRGFQDAEDSAKLRDAVKQLQRAFANNLQKVICTVGEVLTEGQAVNLYDSAGDLLARKASATDSTKPCYGIVLSVLGTEAQILLLGGVYIEAAYAVGTRYFLSTTAGSLTPTAPSASGNIVQAIGLGLDTNNLFFNPSLTWSVVP